MSEHIFYGAENHPELRRDKLVEDFLGEHFTLVHVFPNGRLLFRVDDSEKYGGFNGMFSVDPDNFVVKDGERAVATAVMHGNAKYSFDTDDSHLKGCFKHGEAFVFKPCRHLQVKV